MSFSIGKNEGTKFRYFIQKNGLVLSYKNVMISIDILKEFQNIEKSLKQNVIKRHLRKSNLCNKNFLTIVLKTLSLH